jgi:aryl-alcohol dehydrogenase-like predicted oxidoreductase
MDTRNPLSRRDALRYGVLAGAGLALGAPSPVSALQLDSARVDAALRQAQLPLITRPVPGTGEAIPVIGTGTNRYGTTEPERIAQLTEVLKTIADLGGKVVDTARSYGTSEEVIGEALRRNGARDRLFIATKFSLGGNADPAAARPGLELAFTRLDMPTIDLMMVHNLSGFEHLFPIMQEMKQAGRFRYLGVSTSSDNAYPRLEELMRNHALDFIQVDYSIGNRTAAERILPLAQDRGMAVMLNVPFGGRGGTVLQEVAGRPVPDWAAEFDATSWPQVFLKYLVSHPAVTVAIPGTTQVPHAIDNHGAARGRLPDAAMRRRIEQYYDAL